MAPQERSCCKSAYHQLCQVHRVTQSTDNGVTGNTLGQTTAHRHVSKIKVGDKTIDQAITDDFFSKKLQRTIWNNLRHPNLPNFTQTVIDTAKQTHLGWLSVMMALELRRIHPREGKHSFPYFLYETYGLVMESVALRIQQGIGSDLVLAIMMLVFFETALHGCPEPAIYHLRGLEALLLARKMRSDQLSDNHQLDHYALAVVDVTRSVISARQEFHPQCREHSGSSFTWNVCVGNRPQLAHLRDYVAGILEVVKLETLLVTDGWLKQKDYEVLVLEN